MNASFNKIALFQVLSLVGGLCLSQHSFAAGGDIDVAKMDSRTGRARTEVEKEIEARRERKLKEISLKLGMEAKDLKDFFIKQGKEKKLSRANAESWNTLLKNTTINGRQRASQADYTNANILSEMLGNYIRLRDSNLPDTITIRESDILEIHRQWTAEQKMNFVKVLREAVKIAQSSKAADMEMAFEKALKKMGLLEEYRKSCQR